MGIFSRKQALNLVSMKEKKKEELTAYVMLIPAMFFFFSFIVFPIFKAFQFSLYDYGGIGKLEDFIGFDNYIKGFTDLRFYNALWNNSVLAFWDISIAIMIAFFLAYLIYRKIFAWKFFNTALFIPHIMSIVVVGVLWKMVYEPTNGLLNNLLTDIGLESLTRIWLGMPETALGSVIVVWIWKHIPFNMIILYANMLRIPNELFEAAKMDGASEWVIIRKIVFPMTLPIILLLVILGLSNDFRAFDLVWVMTEGGPVSSTEIATSYVYRQGFSLNNYGYANALSFIVMFLLLSTVGITLRIFKRRNRK